MNKQIKAVAKGLAGAINYAREHNKSEDTLWYAVGAVGARVTSTSTIKYEEFQNEVEKNIV